LIGRVFNFFAYPFVYDLQRFDFASTSTELDNHEEQLERKIFTKTEGYKKKRPKSAKISLQIQALDVAGSGLTKIDRREKQKLRAYISLLFFPGGFFVSLLLVAGK